jgi:hypothetical protein
MPASPSTSYRLSLPTSVVRGCLTSMWTAPELVITSSELPVNDWSFPITPEMGGAAVAWAQTVGDVASAATKVK